jgi:hypothetical protein
MGRKVNLVTELEAAGSDRSGLERVRLGSDEVALIPFTDEAEEIDLHYCREVDIADYAACNGAGCLLCRIGRDKVTRRLLPIYLPAARAVAILPVSPSLRPGSLWPQLAAALTGEAPRAVFVAREQGDRHRVSAVPLADDVDAGEGVIQAFLAEYTTGRVALDSVYPKVSNEELARLPEIAEMLKLKGIRPDDRHPR